MLRARPDRVAFGWIGLCATALSVGCQPHPIAPSTTAAAGAVAMATVSVEGIVLQADGRPAAGVALHVGVLPGGSILSNNGGSLVTGGGGNVISNNGGSLHLLASTVAPTDAQGRFAIAVAAGAVVAIEAIATDGQRALAANLPADTAQGLRLRLAAPGTLAGRVTAPDAPGVTDLSGVEVFIPGTDHLAKTDPTGAFELADVPAGELALVATGDALGSASASGLRLEPNGRLQVPPLALRRHVPVVGAIVPPLAPAGGTLVVRGDGFGASTGQPLEVTLAGAVLTHLTRLDDHTLQIQLPDQAVSGDLGLVVGGVPAPAAHIDVVKRLGVLPERDAVLAGETLPLAAMAFDADGHALGDVPARWEVTGDGGTLQPGGRLQVGTTGKVAIAAAYNGLSATVELPVRAVIALALPPLSAGGPIDSIAAEPDGTHVDAIVRASESGTARIVALDARGGSAPVAFDAPGATPREVAIGPDGTRYVLATDDAVWSLAPGGPARRVLDPATLRPLLVGPGAPPPGPLPTGHGLTIDAAGRLAFELVPGNAVRFGPGASPALVRYAGPPGAPGDPAMTMPAPDAAPVSLFAARGSHLLVVAPQPDHAPVLRDLDAADGPHALSLPAGTTAVDGLAADGAGRLYLASRKPGFIGWSGADGKVQLLRGTPDTPGDGSFAPGRIAVSADGTTLWAVEGANRDRLQRLAILRAPSSP